MLNKFDLEDMCLLKNLHENERFKVDNKEYKFRNIYNDVVFAYDEFGFIHKLSAFIKVTKL